MEKISCDLMFRNVFPFWYSITEEERDYFCSQTMLAHFKKGENIHGAQQECTGGILIKKGVVRSYMLSEEGKEITLYRLYEGDLCMLSASCVLKSITFEVRVDAEEDTDAYIISSKAFAKLVDKYLEVENFALKTAIGRFSDVVWTMQQIMFMSFDKRLAVFLLDEIAKEKSDTIHLTHEQIAKYMSSAREVVSRMLKYFANEGLVEVNRGEIKVLDKRRLRDMTI